ncbi:hypothetical protein CONLIGDRAFT_597592 [Coniochaeta ligniaria NRRL 30616]|uniref:NACHT domain-containing protein n=1 Tax=Coniochaeta ligniaria NRRL 30616 TaxID=1408157 RepID=A0A1J7IL88_9PEZI|nr:hypothetical protein CONLIGDRAFT_597592 [Coniochaeta ligniaria NRRL 30616]
MRIANRRQLMTLQLCALSSESVQGISAQLNQLGGKYRIMNSAQDSRLDLLLQKLGAIEEKIALVRSQKQTTQDSVEVLCADISKLSLDTRKMTKESQIMASLDYNDRPLRHEKIPDAHRTTFQWSLDEKAPVSVKQQSGSFREWLRQKHGLFWVSGKPGSGKSTFMKFIADHEETAALLGHWASSYRLLVARHYFTIYGTLIQRSLEGMLRSLLFEILNQAPELILKALPQYWSEDTEKPVSHTGWTQRELEMALRRIAAEAGTNVRICLFIDGLDEYTGDHFEICETLKQLSQSSCIKICMSSRPWNVFEDALGGCPKLYMHDLTSTDIRNYTNCVLREHPRWTALEEETSPLSSTSLIDDVVTKANGVFLWVTLVTRLLREGLTNGDSVSDLKKRLSIIPSDLRQFFRHILETVDPFYNEKMAGTLLLALHAKTPLPMEVYMFHDFEYDDENYAFKEPTETLSTDLTQVYKRLDSISRRINGRSKGLLERSADRVVFFHRTVFDFLRTPEMEDFLIERARRNFSPVLSTFRAYIAWTKHTDFPGPSPVTINIQSPHQSEDPLNRMSALATRLRSAFRIARDADEQGENCAALTAALLDNMELSIQGMLSRDQIKGASLSMLRGIYHRLVVNMCGQHPHGYFRVFLDWQRGHVDTCIILNSG